MDDAWLTLTSDLRRAIHREPELGLKEFKTVAKIRDVLIADGIDESAFTPGKTLETALVVDIVGTAPATSSSPDIIAIRADMDALPMADTSASPWTSVHEGIAHCCGHDGHIASAVGAALLIHRRRDRLPSNNTVRFLFQPAEEGPGGAKEMVADGCLEGVSTVWGMHNINCLPLGAVWVQPGVASSHCCDFEIEMRGVGGHGSSPHAGKDPILPACQLVTALGSVLQRAVAPGNRGAVLSTTCIQAGTTTNVIPDTAVLKGTIRDTHLPSGLALQEHLTRLSHGIAAAHDVTATVTLTDSYPSIVNDIAESAFMADLVSTIMGPESVVGDVGAMPGAEDMSEFLAVKPGCFIQIGGGTPDTKCPMPHEGAYDYNDDVTPIAAGIWVRLCEAKFSGSGSGAAVVLYDDSDLLFPSTPAVDVDAVEKFKSLWT